MKHFILMCDIIDSRNQPQKLLMENFKKCTQHINQKHQKRIVSPLTITLGDEFQGVILDLKAAIEIIVDIEEFIIENNFLIKLRYVLVYGEIETKINSMIAYEMLGEGLTKARNTLNNLKKKDSRFYIDIENLYKNNILNNSFTIYQNLVDKWKIEKDYELISSFIKNHDYKIVSDDLKIDRAQIWKREKTLNISSYFSVKEILFTTSNYSL